MKAIPLIALQYLPGIGAKTVLKMAGDLPSGPVEFADFVNSRFGHPLQETVHAWDQALQIMDKCLQSNINVVTVIDENYPEKLHGMREDRPPVIYIKGSHEALQSNSAVVAIIGTREPTDRGSKAAYDLGCIAAQNNLPVVSGLAYGCDYHGHAGCLDQGGIAVAILAHGLDMVYPRKHENLANQIIEKGGCLLSEYPPGIQARKWTFIARDRLQSALSDILVVIQTGIRGGTHHTAAFAQTQQKTILCLRPHERELHHPSVQGNADIVQTRNATWIDGSDDLIPLIHNRNGNRPEQHCTSGQLELFPD